MPCMLSTLVSIIHCFHNLGLVMVEVVVWLNVFVFPIVQLFANFIVTVNRHCVPSSVPIGSAIGGDDVPIAVALETQLFALTEAAVFLRSNFCLFNTIVAAPGLLVRIAVV